MARDASSLLRCKSVSSAVLFVCALTASAQKAHFTQAQSFVPGGGGITPYGLAVDAQGRIYIADPEGYVYSTDVPWNVAVDSAGNVYYLFQFSGQVVRQGIDGSQTTLPLTGLSSPEGIAVDSHGDVFIADSDNHRIVEAIPSGGAYTQTVVPTSKLFVPIAVATDLSGNLYIADDNVVLKETASATGWSESVVANAENPTSLATDGAGDVFILEFAGNGGFSNSIVLKESPSAGAYTESVMPSGGQNPFAIATDPAGNLYMNSPQTGILEDLAGPTTTFLPVSVTGSSQTAGVTFSFDAPTTLGTPEVLTEGNAGLDFVNAGTGTCGHKKASYIYNPGDTCFVNVVFAPQRSGSRDGAVVLQDAFGSPLATAYLSGTGSAPQINFPPGSLITVGSGFADPSAVGVDAAGDVFVADTGAGAVFKETGSGSTFARAVVASGLYRPTAVALDGAGNVYILTSGSVFKETPVQGAYQQTPIVIAPSDFNSIAVDHGGNLYLTSSVSGDVHKETLQADGSYNQSAIGYGITNPTGVAVDGAGDVFVLNGRDSALYTEWLQPDGSYLQTTFAPGISAPRYLAVDGNGNVYVSNSSQDEVDKLTPQANKSYVKTVARSGLAMPLGLAADGHGNVYTALATGQVVMVDFADAPALAFPLTQPGSSRVMNQEIANAGNAPLVFSTPSSGTNPSVSAPFALADPSCPLVGVSGVAAPLGPGESCTYSIAFAPQYRSTYAESLSLADNNLNAVSQTQTILLSGASTTSNATRTTLRVSPNPVQQGLGLTVTITVTNTSNSELVPQGSVTITDTAGGQTTPLNAGNPLQLENGLATLVTQAGVIGTHTISVHYSGQAASFLGSSAQASLTVQP